MQLAIHFMYSPKSFSYLQKWKFRKTIFLTSSNGWWWCLLEVIIWINKNSRRKHWSFYCLSIFFSSLFSVYFTIYFLPPAFLSKSFAFDCMPVFYILFDSILRRRRKPTAIMQKLIFIQFTVGIDVAHLDLTIHSPFHFVFLFSFFCCFWIEVSYSLFQFAFCRRSNRALVPIFFLYICVTLLAIIATVFCHSVFGLVIGLFSSI